MKTEVKVIFWRFTEVWNVGKITSNFSMKTFFGFHAKIRCNFPDIPYLSETPKNNFQFLSEAEMLHDVVEHILLF